MMTTIDSARRRLADDAWTDRVLVGSSVGVDRPPSWLVSSYAQFRQNVLHPAFPCYFGTQAEQRGDMFYTFASATDLCLLPAALAQFGALSKALCGQKRSNFAVFFEPLEAGATHDQFRYFCWDVLQYLHDHDPDLDKYDQILDPADAEWEFTFAGQQMFVVGCSPTYIRRRSRNLGPGIILLFQPRSVFIDFVTKKEISKEARDVVRARLLKWDGVSSHPDLGVYGDPDNREWKQYFLPDSDSPETGRCPFLARYRKATVVKNEDVSYDAS